MADYRDEFRSALSQLDALRAENAALRARLRQHESPLRPSGPDDAPSIAPLPPTPTEAPQRTRVMLGAAIVAVTVAGLVAAARVASPREERLLLPNLPEVPVAAGPTAPLPLPATTVRLPDRGDAARVTEVADAPLHTAPVAVDNLRAPSLRWPADRDLGLYVLHTAEPAHCTVGGVMFDSPGVVFLSAGEHQVRCLLGRTRHIWVIPIEARRVTFDTQHPLRSP